MTSLEILCTVGTELRDDQMDLAGGFLVMIACAIWSDHCYAVLAVIIGA